jgi:NO-binding membrane sensor protein with MHYT domain
MPLQAYICCDILDVMHYNLGERTKPKRYIPYRKIAVIVGIVLAVVGTYLALNHHAANIQTPPVKQQPVAN